MADSAPEDKETPPPVLGSWNRLYALVLGALAACVALFAAVTHYYK